MTPLRPLLAAFSLVLIGLSGCAHIDTTPLPVGERVLNGKVNFRTTEALPEGAQLVVRLLDFSNPDAPAQVIAEQVITQVKTSPVPFKIFYRAEEIETQRKARLEARLSVAGKLRYYTTTGYPVSPGDAERNFDLWMDGLMK